MEAVSLICAVALAAVFVTSGVAKLLDRDGTRKAVAGFGIPPRLVPALALLVPAAELLAAALLLPSATTRLGGLLSLALLAGFSVTVALALAAGRQVECHCFGRIGGADISPRTLVRNAVLMVFGVLVALGPSFHGATSRRVLLVLCGLAVAAALVGVEGYAGRQDRLRRDRADAAEFERGMQEPTEQLVVPDFALPSLDGRTVTRDELAGTSDRPTMIAFLSPGCGPCKLVRPSVKRWHTAYRDRLGVVVITSGDADYNRPEYDDAADLLVLLDTDGTVRQAFGVAGTPAAVLLGEHAHQLGPVANGEALMRRLLAAGLAGDVFRPHDEVVADQGAPADSITAASVVTPRSTVTSVTDGDTTLLVDEATGASFSLDPIGSVVWRVLDGTSTLDEIIDDLADAFGAPRDVVANDTVTLAQALGRAGVLAGIAADEPSHEVEPHDHAHDHAHDHGHDHAHDHDHEHGHAHEGEAQAASPASSPA